VTGKYIGFFRLVEACTGSGCPVCACLDDEARRQVTALFDEHVTDVTTRRRLRDAWGLCNWHTSLVVETRATATGVAIVAEDLLRVCLARVESHGGGGRVTGGAMPPARPRGIATRVGAWLGRLVGRVSRHTPPAAVAAYRARPRCPLCTELRASETHCLDEILRFADDPQFTRAYERSSGLCLPHLVALLDRDAAPQARETMLARTLAKWQALRADLTTFVSKHEYRSASAITESESRSYTLALELLAGRRPLFGSDLRGDQGASSSR
jgi:hypothetical protein